MSKLTRQNSHQNRSGISVLACNGALMRGGAFTIDDALIAVRWAEQIQPRGYRVVITPHYQNGDEVIEVYIPRTTKPTFMVSHDSNSVRIVDCIGLTLSFPTLTGALLAMVPLSKSGQREMLKGASPAWLPGVAKKSTQEAGNLWAWVRQICGLVAGQTHGTTLSNNL